MKKKNVLSLIIIVLTFIGFLLYLYARTIDIGVSLRQSHPYVEYTFYGLVLIVVVYFVIRPFMIITFSPSFTLYHLKDGDKNKSSLMRENYHQLTKIANTLINKNLIKDENKELLKIELKAKYDHFEDKYKNMKVLVNQIINNDLKKDIRRIIIRSARDTMYLTALSQNSFVDTMIVLVNNFRMVKKIIVRCGYRPSFFKLLKLYINVIVSSLIAEGAENLDYSSLLGNSLKGIAKPIVGSVIDGALNSFFMLRTGFLTRNYILSETNDRVDGVNILSSAMVEAAAAFPELAVSSVVKPIVDAFKGTIVTPTKDIVKKVFSGKSSYPELENED
jgi:hypothetical protein